MSGVFHSIGSAIGHVVKGIGSMFGMGGQSPQAVDMPAMPAIPPPVPALQSPEGSAAASATRRKNSAGAWGGLESMFPQIAQTAAATDRKSLLG